MQIEYSKLLYQRSLAGMTQQQVADATGMNIRQIQKFESGILQLTDIIKSARV